jgi:hypothetical protein
MATLSCNFIVGSLNHIVVIQPTLVDPAEGVLSILGSDELATLLSKICMILSCTLQQCRIYIAGSAMAYRLAEISKARCLAGPRAG